MAVDLNDIMTAIISRINAAGSLTALSGKTFFGMQPDLQAKPFCRISVVSGLTGSQGYGNLVMETMLLQFSVFAEDFSTANSLVKAINVEFDATKLTGLTGQHSLRIIKRGSGALVEDRENKKFIYHSFTQLEFQLQNS